MARLLFRKVLPGDVEYIAARLRPADRREVEAVQGAGADIVAALHRAVRLSSLAWTAATKGGEPVALFGVLAVSVMTGEGSPWVLATEKLYQCPRTLIEDGKRYVSVMRERYPILYNFVGVWNDKSIRWLERMGFVLAPPTPYGVVGEPFHRFEMRA